MNLLIIAMRIIQIQKAINGNNGGRMKLPPSKENLERYIYGEYKDFFICGART